MPGCKTRASRRVEAQDDYDKRPAIVALLGGGLPAEEGSSAELCKGGTGRVHRSSDLGAACFVHVRSSLFGPLVGLGLRLFRGLRRLGPFALAALEVVVRFAWYVGLSETRDAGANRMLHPSTRGYTDRAFAARLAATAGCGSPSPVAGRTSSVGVALGASLQRIRCCA